MKKIILQEEDIKEILPTQLMGNETVAYKCANSDNYTMLSKINKNGRAAYGFIPIGGGIMQDARFIEDTWIDSIKLAARHRKVYVFDSGRELIEAIYKNKMQ